MPVQIRLAPTWLSLPTKSPATNKHICLPVSPPCCQPHRQPAVGLHPRRPCSHSWRQLCCQAAKATQLPRAGPSDEPPEYTAVDRRLLNRAVMGLFRKRMVQAIQEDSPLSGCGLPGALQVAVTL